MMDAFASLVLTAPPGGFWTLTAVALLAGSAALWRAQVFLARQRLIEDTPTAFIRSAPQGYIELQGRAELIDGDPIHAPLSLRPCTWYRYKVERREQRGNGRGRQGWHTIEQGVSGDLFYLVDDTGRCAIDPDGASVTPAHRQVWYGAQRIPGRYHADDGRWWARVLGQLGQRYRYTELRIEPGDPLYALGRFVTHSASATPTDHGPEIAARLREWKRDRAFLLREFDRDGDGEIDAAEWAAARARAAEEVHEELLAAAPPPAVDLLGRTGDRRRPFIIAAGTEQAAVAHCRRHASGWLALGILLACSGLWATALRLASGTAA